MHLIPIKRMVNQIRLHNKKGKYSQGNRLTYPPPFFLQDNHKPHHGANVLLRVITDMVRLLTRNSLTPETGTSGLGEILPCFPIF